MLIPIFEDVLVVLILLLIGALQTRFILRSWQPLATISLAFPLGGGILTWLIFMVSWLGGLQNLRATVVAVTIFLLIFLGFSQGKSLLALIPNLIDQLRNRLSRSKPGTIPLVIWSVLGVLVLSAFVISLGRSYAGWDAVAFWSLKGYGMALDNSFQTYAQWGAFGFEYPPNIPLLVSFFAMANGDVLPGSKILFPLYFVSLLMGAFRFWRRTGVSANLSRLGLLLLASVPIVFEFATIGYANLPVACFLALGALWGAEGIFLNEPKAQQMSGILFGLAAWTRPDGFLFSLIGIAALTLGSRLMRKGKINLPSLLLPFIVIAGSWLIFYSLNGGGDSQAAGQVKTAIDSALSGDFEFIAFVEIGKFVIRNAIDIRTWGLLFPLCFLALIIAVRTRTNGLSPFFWICLLSALAFGMLTVFMFYIGQFDTEPGFLQGWLGRGFARTLLPAGVLIAVTCVYPFGEYISTIPSNHDLSPDLGNDSG